MELNGADLRKRSKELELQDSWKHKFSPAHISALEDLLLDVYAVLRPTKNDYEHRRNLVHVFDVRAKETYGCSSDFPIVEAFGSFVMDMFTAKSDLDLSLNFSADETASFPREKKISVLRKFAKILYAQQRKGIVSGVLPILRARVPVLKVVHRGTGIECDISVENKDGISRSLIINLMCLVDERFRILSFLMKVWAKAHDINSTKDHTLSSLSIILLVAFHLQTRDPPILPPFSVLLRDGPHPVSVENVVHGLKHFGRANKESVAELFIALLSKISSVRSLWELGLCASTYEGFWISKTWKTDNIGVEDFLDRSQNCARAVGKVELPKIYSIIDGSISHLVQFMNGQAEGSDLKILLFGPAALLHTQAENAVLNGSEIPKKGRKKRKFHSQDSVVAPDNAKKMQHTGRSDQLYSQIPSATIYPKHFVPLYHEPIPGRLSYGVQDHPKHPPECCDLPYHRSQPLLLSPALACGSHLPGPPFNACQSGYGSHDPFLLEVPNLAYGPEHCPPPAFVPLGLQSGYQSQSPLISRELHYRRFHDARLPLSQSSHPDFGLHSIHPTPLVDGRHTVQFEYLNQHPGQQLARPFYQG